MTNGLARLTGGRRRTDWLGRYRQSALIICISHRRSWAKERAGGVGAAGLSFILLTFWITGAIFGVSSAPCWP